MSNLPRSKSTSHVAPAQPFLVPGGSKTTAQGRPLIPRHRTSLALTELTSSSSRSGHQTPRTDREDPFSLGGFFPPQLSTTTPDRPDTEWGWLRNDEAAIQEDLIRENEFEEDDETILSHVMFDRTEDLRTGEMILQEDKLGILSLRSDLFSSYMDLKGQSQGDAKAVGYDRLLSPYCEDNPLDDDAVYKSLAALRQAHADISSPPTNIDGSGALFSPVEDATAEKYEEAGSWPAILSQGVSLVLDYLSI
ncbi:hypothetical protein BDW22DRAFT_80743 [Trametopsis cervina]|nr:hypothetical protein BDW22DRAFT_80743 [Trametopsis cervina]